MVTIRVESDSPSDVGKSFGGTKITAPRKSKSSSSSAKRRRRAEAQKIRDTIAKQIAEAAAIVVAEAKKKAIKRNKAKTLEEVFKTSKPTISVSEKAQQQSKTFFQDRVRQRNNRIPEALRFNASRKTPQEEVRQKALTGQTQTPTQIKQFKSLTSVQTKSGRILKELTPFLNTESQQTYKRLRKGLSPSGKDIVNIALDLITLVPGSGFVIKGVGNVVKAGARALKIGGSSKIIAIPVTIIPRAKSKIIRDTAGSIIRDIGATQRVTEAAKEFFDVDENFLKSSAKTLGLKDEKDLYNNYISVIGAKTKDGRFRTDDITNFLGVDYFKKSTVKAGQREFNDFLRGNGLSQTQANKIISNLEQFRKARQFGQLFGFVKTEVSSERLAQTLLKRGVGKKTAVGIAGAREGLSTVLQEGFIQGYTLTPADFALAVFSGVTGSIFFSKTKLKDIKPKDLDKSRNKMTNAIFKKLSDNRKSRYLTKLIKANSVKVDGSKLSTSQIKTVKIALDKTDKDKLVKSYVKQSIVDARGKIPRKKAKILLRDPIANIIDPFEIVGDSIVELTDRVSAKVRKKLSIRKSKLKKGKVKAKVLTRSKSITKAKTSVKAKGISKATTKTRPKPITKTKPKIATRTKTKTKTKVATKSKTKTKTRVVTKSKTKTKTKTKIIEFPIFKFPKQKLKKGEVFVLQAKAKLGAKVVGTITSALPLREAIDRGVKEITVGRFPLARSISFKVVGVKKVKDTGRGSLKGFKRKVGKNPLVQEFVQINPLGTKRERLALQKKKRL